MSIKLFFGIFHIKQHMKWEEIIYLQQAASNKMPKDTIIKKWSSLM